MELTLFDWFKVASAMGAFIAAVAVWLWGRDRAHAVSSAVDAQQLGFIHRRIDDDRRYVHERFEQANTAVSKLSSYVQELPTRHEYDDLARRITALEGRR